MIVHNLSSYQLTNEDFQLLSKGLSFTPTPNIPPHISYINILQQYNEFARTVRLQFARTSASAIISCDKHIYYSPPEIYPTSHTYRPMKFLPKRTYTSPTSEYCTNARVETYIQNTKDILNEHLPTLCNKTHHNLTIPQQRALKKLKKSRSTVTIKPADKNLGIVLLNTEDYIDRCMEHLRDTKVYRLAHSFPDKELAQLLTNQLVASRHTLHSHSKSLYLFLQPKRKHRTPQFYGIPKIHKHFTQVPPMRPIVSHTNSLLSPTAKFIDHILQPLAQLYEDYIENSTSLILQLEELTIPDNVILVSIDVETLYPSIPQSECLDIIYNEMYTHRELILFDPNLVIKLLHININYNYFNFAGLIFQQIRGTAMGASFSPTIANIFLSVILKKFMQSQRTTPIFLARYIDDIFMLWPGDQDLHKFMNALNSFHPTLHFTYESSLSSIDYLDLTIYKGERFSTTQRLDVKTYQKPQNLYQYLHYTSSHPQSVFKGLIIGECKRYVRTNTSQENFHTQIQLFKKRLHRREYPHEIVNKYCSQVTFNRRTQYLKLAQPKKKIARKPIFKCLPPPSYAQLKNIILQDYHKIQELVPRPLFIALGHTTLKRHLVRAHLEPSPEQLFDIIVTLPTKPHEQSQHKTAGKLPTCHRDNAGIKACHNPRCTTCTHLNTNPNFKSTSTGTTYSVRHSFSCTSSQLVYLITCTKCRKQYVGMTMNTLNYRITRHRSSILCKANRYLCNHFNFPDHSLKNLSVQPIDTQTNPTVANLQKLEKYWIHKLQTYRPKGLNNTL